MTNHAAAHANLVRSLAAILRPEGTSTIDGERLGELQCDYPELFAEAARSGVTSESVLGPLPPGE